MPGTQIEGKTGIFQLDGGADMEVLHSMVNTELNLVILLERNG